MTRKVHIRESGSWIPDTETYEEYAFCGAIKEGRGGMTILAGESNCRECSEAYQRGDGFMDRLRAAGAL